MLTLAHRRRFPDGSGFIDLRRALAVAAVAFVIGFGCQWHGGAAASPAALIFIVVAAELLATPVWIHDAVKDARRWRQTLSAHQRAAESRRGRRLQTLAFLLFCWTVVSIVPVIAGALAAHLLAPLLP